MSPWVCPAQRGMEGPALARIPVWQAGDRNWAPNHREDDSRGTKVSQAGGTLAGPRAPRIPTRGASNTLGVFYFIFIEI